MMILSHRRPLQMLTTCVLAPVPVESSGPTVHGTVHMEGWAAQGPRASALRRRRGAAAASLPTPHAPNEAIALAVAAPPSAPPQRGARGARRADAGDGGLLRSTALLSLETARKLRALTAAMVRTTGIPDSSGCGMQVKALAETERTYLDTEPCYVWAQLILVILGCACPEMPAECVQTLRVHAAAATAPEALLGQISECTVTRCYAGTSSNWRLVCDSDLVPVARAAIRCLMALGCSVRFGAAPKSQHERAVSFALSH